MSQQLFVAYGRSDGRSLSPHQILEPYVYAEYACDAAILGADGS